MEWIYAVAAVIYVAVGVVSCWAFKTRGALEVMLAVLFWPFLCVAMMLCALVEGLTSRR